MIRQHPDGTVNVFGGENVSIAHRAKDNAKGQKSGNATFNMWLVVVVGVVISSGLVWWIVTGNLGPTPADRKPPSGGGPPSVRASAPASAVTTSTLREVDYADTANGLGLIAIFTGPESPEEDQRIREYLAASTTVRFMAYTGERFVVKFKQDLELFFRKPGARMEVLLADPTDPFYINNTILTEPATEQPGGSVSGFTGNQLGTKTQLIGCGAKPEQLTVKQFTNQMRLPAIIFDHVCVLTVRLPNARRQTIRMEYKNISDGYYSQVSDHFNVVWSKAVPMPEVKADQGP